MTATELTYICLIFGWLIFGVVAIGMGLYAIAEDLSKTGESHDDKTE